MNDETMNNETMNNEQSPPLDVEDIDLRALAEEVYVLLEEELRLERERRGWRQVW